MKYNNYVIYAVEENMDGECTIILEITNQKELEEANNKAQETASFYWAVYGKTPEGLSEAISDFKYLPDAQYIYTQLNIALQVQYPQLYEAPHEVN